MTRFVVSASLFLAARSALYNERAATLKVLLALFLFATLEVKNVVPTPKVITAVKLGERQVHVKRHADPRAHQRNHDP